MNTRGLHACQGLPICGSQLSRSQQEKRNLVSWTKNGDHVIKKPNAFQRKQTFLHTQTMQIYLLWPFLQRIWFVVINDFRSSYSQWAEGWLS